MSAHEVLKPRLKRSWRKIPRGRGKRRNCQTRLQSPRWRELWSYDHVESSPVQPFLSPVSPPFFCFYLEGSEISVMELGEEKPQSGKAMPLSHSLTFSFTLFITLSSCRTSFYIKQSRKVMGLSKFLFRVG